MKDLVKYNDYELAPRSAYSMLDIPIKFTVRKIDTAELMENFESLGMDEFFEVLKSFNLPFYITDIIGVYIARPDLVKPTVIFDIIYDTGNFDASEEQLHKKIIEYMVSYINIEALKEGYIKGEYLICTNSVVSTTEFGEDQWYLEDIEKEEGKMKIPFKEVMKRNDEALVANKFRSINNYCNLEWSCPYILLNNHGEKFKFATDMIVDSPRNSEEN
jgi:hypothetical protein